ncbi:MAG: GNAT family N-acetyltransferase [Acetatifactor sp.]|nr:GNAT family N-acetyltransferase [Acetatifactor sp.]
MKIEKLALQNLYILTELFEYDDVEKMISKYTRAIQNGKLDIFVLYDNELLIGELHVMYECADENYAVRGRRAYLSDFRVREGYQNKGRGTYLLKSVLTMTKAKGYYEFTVGVEDDNERAKHIYLQMGFDELLLRKQEDTFEYNLYLKR